MAGLTYNLWIVGAVVIAWGEGVETVVWWLCYICTNWQDSKSGGRGSSPPSLLLGGGAQVLQASSLGEGLKSSKPPPFPMPIETVYTHWDFTHPYFKCIKSSAVCTQLWWQLYMAGIYVERGGIETKQTTLPWKHSHKNCVKISVVLVWLSEF